MANQHITSLYETKQVTEELEFNKITKGRNFLPRMDLDTHGTLTLVV